MTHMKTKIGEYAIITNSKNEFLMLQFNEPINSWHFPRGRLDEGEQAKEGLIREIKEETRLEIHDLKPIHTTIFTDEKKYGVFYLAKVKEPYEVIISKEHQSFKWYKKEDINKINFWQPFYKEMLNNNL